MILRKPSVAGQFYSASRADLEKELSSLVDHDAQKDNCLGAVSPHAGYIYSGMVAGKVLSRIRFKDSFIILGPNHTGLGKPFSLMREGFWQTPLGKIEIDSDLAGAILRNSKHVKEDAGAHIYEHSIEVQLPFLQYIERDFKFVPIITASGDMEILQTVGSEIAAAIKESKKDVVVIASSDMTHYESRESAKEKDTKAIEAILKLNEKLLMDEIKKWDISMCGFAPTIIMLSALKELGAKKAELVDYKTSGDVSGDYSSVVGYAGILIKE